MGWHDLRSYAPSFSARHTESFWSNSVGIVVGLISARNSLIVTNGGQILHTGVERSKSGVGQVAGGPRHNAVIVTGAGSVWSHSNGDIVVGLVGHGNRLIIADAGQVVARDVIINDNFFRASDNWALVTDSGSLLAVRRNLAVGYHAPGGRLTIANGGAVTIASNAYVGRAFGADNRIVVADGSLAVTNAGGGTLDMRRGALQIDNGAAVTANRLLASHGAASVVEFNGGRLSAGTIDISANAAFRFTGGELRVGTFVGNLLNQGGTLSPGASTGLTPSTRRFTMPSQS